MLNKMYVDMKELLVIDIDQDKLHIVKDFQDYQFYKHSSLFEFEKINIYILYFQIISSSG